ncbi:MAG: hypothetical protein IJ125_04465 [Atopobiaceae bacterium]|nr:hypothetical protein [Atopobiaceae bacterium]
MFNAVFEKEEIAQAFLELVLGVEIEKVCVVKSEEEQRPAPDLRGIRCDVFVKDGKGTIYDVEMQAASTK